MTVVSEDALLAELQIVFRDALGIDPIIPIDRGDPLLRRPRAGLDRRRGARRGHPAALRPAGPVHRSSWPTLAAGSGATWPSAS